MKLQELAVVSPTKQAAKVFESYFGDKIAFENISKQQAHRMLGRVRNLVREHRSTPEFHHSEKNPTYLKLVMLEQALAARISEVEMTGQQVTPADAQKQAAAMSLQQQQRKKQIQDQIKQKQQELQALQKQLTMPMAEARNLREASEIQQAQVVLAAQDMVDQVQKMSEQVSAMQFKDLPALVDQIKNEVGVDQATQFNGDASAALSALLQNLQGSRAQLEQALGVITGQAQPMELPADGAPPEGDTGLGAELPPAGEEELDVDVDADIEEPEGSVNDLGRKKR